MVKRPSRPSPGVVTGLTAHTEYLLVLVIIFMARIAITGSIFVTECCVALAAIGNDVFAG
jgi:hypothetical protein